MNEIAYRMYDWYTHIRMQEAKLSFGFYDRTSDIARKIASHPYFNLATVSISMIFKPRMGARLEITKDNWRVSYDFANHDIYEKTIEILQGIYQQKYSAVSDWT